MLRIDAVVAGADVANACGDVVVLVDGEGVEAGGYGGTQDGKKHYCEQEKGNREFAPSGRRRDSGDAATFRAVVRFGQSNFLLNGRRTQ